MLYSTNFNHELYNHRIIFNSHTTIYLEMITNSYEFVQNRINDYTVQKNEILSELDDEGKKIFECHEGDDELSIKYETPKRHYFSHIIALISFLENSLNRFIIDMYKTPVKKNGEIKIFNRNGKSKITNYHEYLVLKESFDNELVIDYFNTITAYYSKRNKIAHGHDWGEEFLNIEHSAIWLQEYTTIDNIITNSPVTDNYLLKNYKSTLVLYFAIKEYLEVLFNEV